MNPAVKAREILVRQSKAEFSPDITQMRFGHNIDFATIEEYVAKTGQPLRLFDAYRDGCVFSDEAADYHLILTREGVLPVRARFTQAHEIGHVVMNHKQDNIEEEQAANQFACELLMPEFVLLELRKRRGGITPAEVAALFGVSAAAARVQLRRIEARTSFSPRLHREIMAKYSPLIAEYTAPAPHKTIRRREIQLTVDS
jgi:hypothetical protein